MSVDGMRRAIREKNRALAEMLRLYLRIAKWRTARASAAGYPALPVELAERREEVGRRYDAHQERLSRLRSTRWTAFRDELRRATHESVAATRSADEE